MSSHKIIRLATFLFFLGVFSFYSPVSLLAATISHGAMLGAVSDTSVNVWVRASGDSTFKVEYKLTSGSYPGTITSGISLTSSTDHTGAISITGLTANTSYDYRVLLDDVVQGGATASGTFTTLKPSGSACSYRMAQAGDFDGSRKPHSLFTTIKTYNPAFTLFTGDQIYGPSWINGVSIWETYYQQNWSDGPFSDYMKDIAGVFMWDDHELGTAVDTYDPVPAAGYGNNWHFGKSDVYVYARQAFDEYQSPLNHAPVLSGEIYNTFSVCDTAFFMADTRTHRSSDWAYDSYNNDMLGAAQMEALKSWLKNTTATFKFIILPTPFSDAIANTTFDVYKSFRNERTELINFITKNKIQNVISITGDQHAAFLAKNALSPVNNLYEFSATPINYSSLSAGIVSAGMSTVLCTNAVQSSHFGIIDVDTTASPAQIIFKAYNSSNSLICSNTITATNMSPTAPTFSSAANQAFAVGAGTTAISTMTVTDAGTPTITATNDIRIRIPSGFNMVWDTTDTTAVIGGAASAKVSTTVSYEESGKVLVLNVTSSFAGGDSITVSGLSFKTFSSSSVSNLGIDTGNDGVADSSDTKTIKVVSSGTKVWTALGGDSLWTNPLNWSGMTAPSSGDNVVFDSTNTTNAIIDRMPTTLNNFTLDTGYTGTVDVTPYGVNNVLGVFTIQGDLTVNAGQILFEGDSHIDGDPSTPSVVDGTGFTINADNINVGANGTLSANGEGFEQGIGPGVADPGASATSTAAGGSYGGKGGYGNAVGVAPASTYGSFSQPLSLGSGGSFGYMCASCTDVNGVGGGGGGALKINVPGSVVVNGTLSANGDSAYVGSNGNHRYGAGSGGSIWVYGGTLSGSGTISANGGSIVGTGTITGGAGGGGRISLADTTNTFTGSLQVLGGNYPATAGSVQRGRAGTIAFPSSQLSNFTLSNALTLGNDHSYTFGDLTISSGGTLTLDGDTQSGTGATLNATNITISSGGTLTANGKGYEGGVSLASGVGGSGGGRGGGGGYGGRGGYSGISYGASGGATYGSAVAPTSLGSGGGGVGSAGGGALKIVLANGGTLAVSGTLSANGESSTSISSERGAGSGGSIWVYGGTLSGSGTISANGGSIVGTGTITGGAGGGGRISLADTTNTFTGSLQVLSGAKGSGVTASTTGVAGTIAFPQSQKNNFTLSNALTLGNDISYDFTSLTIASGGTLTLDSSFTANSGNGSGGTINAGNLTINSGGTLTATSMGHTGYSGPSAGRGVKDGTSGKWGGSGHGGAGGAGAAAYGSPAGGTTYDSSSAPVYPGVGLSSNSINRGGGAIRLNVGNTFALNGTLSANGGTLSSGGSIYITTKNYQGSTGSMTANGGASSQLGDGSGGGGRIAIEYLSKTYSGTAPTASAGTLTTGTNQGTSGSAGTVNETSLGSDSVAPTVSNILATPTHNSVVITWNTNEQSSSIIDYGTTSGYGTTTTETDTSPRVLLHSVTINGLTPSTSYHFQITSKDDAGTPNLGTSSDQTFTTDAAPDTTAPSISNIVATPTHNSVQITWDTDENGSSFVDYGATASYGTTTSEADTSPRVTSHSVTISGLSSSTTYHFRVNSNDASSNLGTSSDQTFTTDAAPSSGGGGGSSGGSSGGRIKTIPSAQVPVQIPQSESPTPYIFVKDLKYTLVSSDVLMLQKYLNTHGFVIAEKGAGSPGHETNKFGALTKKALIKFQKAKGIIPSVGYMGPKTRAYINAHQ